MALCPGVIVPVSNAVLVLVAVCEVWSWLVKVTFVPVATVIVAGW